MIHRTVSVVLLQQPIPASLQSIIQDLKKNFEIVKLITGSLVCCHRLAVTAGGNNGLSGSTLVDGRYTYQEVRLCQFHSS